MVELACAVHVHTVHSDGTGTIPEVAAAARRVGADVVVVTDHDTLAGLAQQGEHDGVLVVVGEEVSPRHGSHLLCLGHTREVGGTGRNAHEQAAAARALGAATFAAHPFSRGGFVLGRLGRAAPFGDLRADVDGLEVWSVVTDELERIRSPRTLLRFRRAPDAVLADPRREALAAWDALSRTRRVAGIAGLDAHQFGVRRGGRVRLRTMPYERLFGALRTHVLARERSPAGVVEALREGRCFLARDGLADARGFAFDADDGAVRMGGEAAFAGQVLAVHAPRPALLRILRDGEEVARADDSAELSVVADRPGAYRAEAHVHAHGRRRTWVLTNPVHLR